uniref:Uncharacterized protein n=1 Tax=Meloidogyne floridensis TaxID=298350 RepID=A0A915NJ43_9BILA
MEKEEDIQQPSTKKLKKTPLKSIKIGESMIDIKLMILICDGIRTVKEKNTICTFVCTDGDIKAELYSTNSIKNVSVKQKHEAKVLDISLLIENRKVKLTAWNILAEFLYYLLIGKEGNSISLQNIQVKEGEIRLKIIKKPIIMNYKKKENGTLATDGKHKTQLIFPSSIELNNNDEIILNRANAEKNKEGVLTLLIFEENAFSKENNKIMKCKIDDLEYP